MAHLPSSRGLITLVIGIATFFKMPPSPTQTKAWFRPNGWFTEREEIIIVNRVLRDDPTKVRYPVRLTQVLCETLLLRATCIIGKGLV